MAGPNSITFMWGRKMNEFAELRASARLVGLARAVSELAAGAGQRDLARYADRAAIDFLRTVATIPDYDLAVHQREADALVRRAARSSRCL